MISDNLKEIEKEIESACLRSGRKREDIELLAVTKGVETKRIEEAYLAGVRSFGENYVQEAIPKIEALSKYKDIRWHFIGALQSNKASKIATKVQYIHSVDRWSLVAELDRLAKRLPFFPKLLVEINIAQEESKSGISGEELKPFLERISRDTSLSISGLMAFPPNEKDIEKLKGYFTIARKYFNLVREWNFPRIEGHHLSMGISSDFKVAIEEGSTIVRLGTAIFGRRS